MRVHFLPGILFVGAILYTGFPLGNRAQAGTLELIYSGNLDGELEPCGC